MLLRFCLFCSLLLISSVDYYLMLNNIEVEDMGTTKEEFSLEMKKKFISNSNSMLMKGTEIIKEMFLILGVDMLLYS